MSDYLAALEEQIAQNPTQIAYCNSSGEQLTYGQLGEAATCIQQALRDAFETQGPQGPLVPVYGHKSPLMIASFLACLRSGCGYVPLDISLPDERAAGILQQLQPAVMLASEPLVPELAALAGCVIDVGRVCSCAPANAHGGEEEQQEGQATKQGTDQMAGQPAKQAADQPGDEPAKPKAKAAQPTNQSYNHVAQVVQPANQPHNQPTSLAPEDIHYIIFTSGSTGTPKGVQVTARNVDAFMEWASTLPVGNGPHIYLNQAPFSFDLSGYELYSALPKGSSIFALTKSVQESTNQLMEALAQSNADVWVSTPSFATLCLATSLFNQDLMPQLKTFIFCGEPLKANTVAKLTDRFPQAIIYNTYGPTESTVAVTSVPVNADTPLIQGLLPCGKAKPGTILHICDPHTGEEVAPGQQGEIVIEGNTVARGYFGRPDLTAAAFDMPAIESEARSYHTGDLGFLDKDGTLYCLGRLDNQIKLNGYRIELEDIEENLCKTSAVRAACVVPVMRDGSVSYLLAYVVPEDAFRAQANSDERAERLKFSNTVKEELNALMPAYMIPRKIAALDELPMTSNGKVDRKRLASEAS